MPNTLIQFPPLGAEEHARDENAAMFSRALVEAAVRRHTGTLLPDQSHVPAHVPALCRSKCLIQRRCAGVPATEREAVRA